MRVEVDVIFVGATHMACIDVQAADFRPAQIAMAVQGGCQVAEAARREYHHRLGARLQGAQDQLDPALCLLRLVTARVVRRAEAFKQSGREWDLFSGQVQHLPERHDARTILADGSEIEYDAADIKLRHPEQGRDIEMIIRIRIRMQEVRGIENRHRPLRAGSGGNHTQGNKKTPTSHGSSPLCSA